MAFSRRKVGARKKPNYRFLQSYSCGNAKKYAMLFVGQLYYNLWILSPTSTNPLLEQTESMLPTFCLVYSQVAASDWGKIT